MKRLTEEDTFKALSRAPWSEVRRLYNDLYSTGDLVTHAVENEFFQSLGWTFVEFVNFSVSDDGWLISVLKSSRGVQ